MTGDQADWELKFHASDKTWCKMLMNIFKV